MATKPHGDGFCRRKDEVVGVFRPDENRYPWPGNFYNEKREQHHVSMK